MNPDMRPSAVGARAEAEVAAALVHAGKEVYVPSFGAHARCDLVFEDDRGLHRVQCKSARVMNGAVFFWTCSQTGNVPLDYRDQADVFGVYCPPLGAVYLVPVQDVSTRGAHLRLDPPRNNQRKGIRWAADYLLRDKHR